MMATFRQVLIAVIFVSTAVLLAPLYAAWKFAHVPQTIFCLWSITFALWLVYAGGLDNLLLSVLLYVPGVVLFALTRRQRGEQVFTRWEWVLFGAILIVAIVTLVAFWRGALTL